ncbi:MAG: sigma 54-interacting transcriptional regulator [Acidobacteriota bacterium]
MHRLVAYAHNGVHRFVVDREVMTIGSDAACDIRLTYPGVAQQHARLRRGDGSRLEIDDLGSRKGVLVNGRRVKTAGLEVLDEIRLGSIALLIEDVVTETPVLTEPEPVGSPTVTITATGLLGHLARIARWVLSDAAATTTLESLVTDLLADFGGGVVFLFQGSSSLQAIKFVVATEARWLTAGEELLDRVTEVLPGDSPAGVAEALEGRLGDDDAWIAAQRFRALDRPYLFVVALPRYRPGRWSPLEGLETLGDLLLLGLVHHVGRFEPILLGLPEQPDLTLAPGLVVGESKTMKRVIEQLRAAVDPPVTVLLRGEPGVSKELLARSLHLSGPQRDGPFVVASCRGAKEFQIEADLFGAEVQGKHGPIHREGKMASAHGGTLFLDDIEHLPMALQDRLVRFLRAGEVEPTDSLRVHKVDVRLIVASEKPLEAYAARDVLRIDLAYRLSQYAVDVPALRDRREDLPLLIQATVNRCCHDTGKRVQGITVKALEALAVYDYPGNLPELEAIVRRLVYLCPPGRPIEEAMLSEEVRHAKLEGLRPETGSDLSLDRLVAMTERTAIREALKRSEGNKSEASRLLGLSRNGLAMKIKRLGLKT